MKHQPDEAKAAVDLYAAVAPTFRIAVNRKYVNKLAQGDPRWGEFNDTFETLTLSPDGLAQEVQAGHAFTAPHRHERHRLPSGKMSAYRHALNFEQAQHLALDCDHIGFTPLLSEPLVRDYASFLYATASHTPESPRTRVVFILSEPITDPLRYGLAASALVWKFSGEADSSCTDPARCFFGFKGGKVHHLGNVLPSELVNQLIDEFTATMETERARRQPRRDYAPSTPDLQKIADALTFIPKQMEYLDWLRVGMGVHAEYPGPEGVALVEAWSPGYPGEWERKFASFSATGNAKGKASIGTLFYMAKEHGWQPAAHRNGSGAAEPDAPPVVVLSNPPAPAAFHLTDLGNSARFAAQHNEKVRYCHSWGCWLTWDGRRWAKDETQEVVRLARQTVAGIYGEAQAAEDTDERKKIAGWAIQSESDRRIAAMLHLAQSEEAIKVTNREFDADLMLFNCSNGTLDLCGGALRAHRQGDMLTRLAPVDYDPDARLDLLDRFLTDTTGADAHLAAFTARAGGYTLTGLTHEEALFLVLGPTNSGKTTLLEMIGATLGEYALAASFKTFLASDFSNGSSADPDVARLDGARFVRSSESKRGKKLDEDLLKNLTGGDAIVARFLHRNPFEFTPKFKLWLASNFEPRVTAEDDAIWRRIIRLPFIHSVPVEKRDPAVKRTLTDPAQAGSAVLAWLVHGCLEWQRIGLAVPDLVRNATSEYRSSQDTFGRFLQERCVLGDGKMVSANDLRVAYEQLCRENDDMPTGSREWARLLRDNGCKPGPGRVNNAVSWCWHGIGLKADDEQRDFEGERNV